jgi:AAA domain/DnaB-like helicase N terminal domain
VKERPPLDHSQRSRADSHLDSTQAERACLGAALLDNRLLREPLGVLAVDDFSLSAHREIFKSMLESDAEGLPFDILTLVESLQQKNKLEAIGNVAYLDSLTDGVMPHPGLIHRHAETVIRFSRLRQLQKVADGICRWTQEPGVEPARVVDQLETAIRAVREGYDLDGNLLPIKLRVQARRAEILTLATVEAKSVPWLWKPYLAAGMLAMLSGDPGAGKTYIALAIAAGITTGRSPYTGDMCEPGDVLYLSVENSPEHVLRPRFDSLAGDPKRFHILQGAITGESTRAVRGSVRLADVSLLQDALKGTKAKLVIVDPIQSYLGAEVDAHRSNETRPVMDGLSRLAEEYGCCVLLVRHLSKAPTGKAIHRGLGSIDLTGAVRTELLVGCSPDDPAQRALVQVKSNIGQLGSSLGYTIEADGTFRWTGETQLTASAILSPEMNGEETGALAEAKSFLLSALADGARPAIDIQTEAQREGIRERTLKRAKKSLGIVSRKSSMSGSWEWLLPEGSQE